MQRIEREGLVWYQFTGPGPLLEHAALTRLGGASQAPFTALNLGSTVGDDPAAVAENYRRVCRALDLSPQQIVTPYQVHGSRVVQVDGAHGGSVIPGTDALITATPGLALLLRFADCTPVLFYDAEHHVGGLAHAGWRGVAAGVIPATVQALRAAFGSRPESLWAGIGPAIGRECYEVGAEVVEAIAATLPEGTPLATRQNGRWHLDMPGAVAAQLAQAGVYQVERSEFCTASRTDLWYSHRAEAGQTGRFGVVVKLAE